MSSALAIVATSLLVSAWTAGRLVGPQKPPRPRDVHVASVSRWGGLAIGLGFIAALVAAWLAGRGVVVQRADELRMLVGGGALALGLGLLDDHLELAPFSKLSLQVLLAAPVVWAWPEAHPVPPMMAGLWVVAVINAVNLVDGLDELAAGVVAIAAGTLAFVGVVDHRGFLVVTAGGLLGATLGFWRLNRSPARLFLGDSGSHFCGFVLGVVSLLVPTKTLTAMTLAPVLLLGLPLLELVSSAMRRMASGRSPMKADLEHLHHRLIASGWTEHQAVRMLHSLALAGAGTSLVVVDIAPSVGLLVGLVAMAMAIRVALERPEPSVLRLEMQAWVNEGLVRGAVARRGGTRERLVIVGAPRELSTLVREPDGFEVLVDAPPAVKQTLTERTHAVLRNA